MFCWLAFGEHEALTRDLKRARILISAKGKSTTTTRVFPTESRVTALRRPPLEGPNILLLAVGEHEVLKRVMKRARILIPAEGKPTTTARIFPTENCVTALRRLPLGGTTTDI